MLEKTLQSSLKRSNQLTLKKISFEYSLEGLMLKLKLQHFGHLMRRADSLEKTLMMGKTEGERRRGRQRMQWLNGISDSMDMNLSKLREMVKDREAWCAIVSPWGCKESDMTEIRRGIQAASCVGPGKSNLPFELRRKAGDCSRVTAGPIDLI